jgi:pSer/pThr/pTyr-binding forkhead associated (FHA) protein
VARLILSLEGQVLAEYNLNKERYTIGRYPDNDIRIDNPAVSGHHSLIINILNDSFLEDLNSTNGTYVNGKLIKKHSLQHGDVITAGHHQLRFVEDNEVRDTEFETTMVIAPHQALAPEPAPATLQRSVTLDAVATSPSLVKPPLKAKLQVLSGAFAGREMELAKTLTTLGRPGVQVAAISRRADGFYIVLVDSAKADDFPLVNGASIGAQARHLEDNDVIQIAGVKMGFFTR